VIESFKQKINKYDEDKKIVDMEL